jgi:hypothetical protein
MTEVDGVEMSDAAAKCVFETGVDVMLDVDDLRGRRITRSALLEKCLDGADEDREQGWEEYVEAVCKYAAAYKRK